MTSTETERPMHAGQDSAAALLRRIDSRDAEIGVIGLGYVGLPLVQVFWGQGFKVTGFDLDPEKVAALKRGESYIEHIADGTIQAISASGRFDATSDFSELARVDAILICVPTPLAGARDPDLSYVENTAKTIAETLRPGQLVVLESTTYPGTTDEVIRPILERSGLKSGVDFFLAYSPEREDPGNPTYGTAEIPKVVGGDGPAAMKLATTLYGTAVVGTVPVSSTATAEAVKLTENIFRAVNIALVNELKQIYAAMDVDVWEVIEAAKTKPFGFMPFYPGPGLGGHCIPIDPFYLSWRARQFGHETRFIELAGEINTAMPSYVIDRLCEALGCAGDQPLAGKTILMVGLAYKKNVDDIRESPGLTIIDLLEQRGATVHYHDPHIPVLVTHREHAALSGRESVDWDAATVAACDAALICTDHDRIDYGLLATHAKLVVDTRNVMERKGFFGQNVVKA